MSNTIKDDITKLVIVDLSDRAERGYNKYSTIKDDITKSVIVDLSDRSERGYNKYSTTLEQNNHDEFTQHLYEELLDAAQYCKKIITQKQAVQDLVKTYPNDAELGAKIREIYGQTKADRN